MPKCQLAFVFHYTNTIDIIFAIIIQIFHLHRNHITPTDMLFKLFDAQCTFPCRHIVTRITDDFISLYFNVVTNVTGFGKTNHTVTRTKIQFIA